MLLVSAPVSAADDRTLSVPGISARRRPPLLRTVIDEDAAVGFHPGRRGRTVWLGSRGSSLLVAAAVIVGISAIIFAAVATNEFATSLAAFFVTGAVVVISAAVLPNARHVELDGLGHDGPWNHGGPERVAAVVSTFLTSV
ncbi:hypothetical protein DEI93_13550 [Curtobacterium sp. MCBD17_035]|uniref:hypothetical protein n=1 Tax=Curtobacterium sp. MCBD17_035 TaxID=2175673 RepID=UPI0011B65D17|nr:hypothetical protein [Curtobacterium sp. MCBD17_035]WIB66972.1 hypothetical protein DEI93_13550 [Curtobacterium sp. MCBD17_035]